MGPRFSLASQRYSLSCQITQTSATRSILITVSTSQPHNFIDFYALNGVYRDSTLSLRSAEVLPLPLLMEFTMVRVVSFQNYQTCGVTLYAADAAEWYGSAEYRDDEKKFEEFLKSKFVPTKVSLGKSLKIN